MERDPAARGVLEVVLCYPGFHALVYYRMSNWLWRHQFFLLSRFVSHIGKMLTTIEIHPGARIGERFVIDHGTGVVIGETAVVGDDVLMFNNINLGGTSMSPGKRHPTLENDVVVGAGAKVLGPFTVGTGARIGSNAVVVKEVPPGCTAVGVPAKLVKCKNATPAEPAASTENAFAAARPLEIVAERRS